VFVIFLSLLFIFTVKAVLCWPPFNLCWAYNRF